MKLEIRREEFDLLKNFKILGNGEYYITCRHKKSKRKKYHIAADTIRYRIAKLMKNREAPREIVSWFYGRFGSKKKIGA